MQIGTFSKYMHIKSVGEEATIWGGGREIPDPMELYHETIKLLN